MGNEVSTVGGTVVTATAGVLAVATFGQVESINNVVAESAKYTAAKAQQTIVRHVGETIVVGTAAVSAGVASAVTLGQVKAINEAVVNLASQTASAGIAAGTGVLQAADSMADSMPGVGHAKGVVLISVGATERGQQAMAAASRTTCVVAGGIVGIAGGPAGMIGGGIAGGAAADAIATGVLSVRHGEYRPKGCLEQVQKAVLAENSTDRVSAVIGGTTRLLIDGIGGWGAGDYVGGDGMDIADVDGVAIDFDWPEPEDADGLADEAAQVGSMAANKTSVMKYGAKSAAVAIAAKIYPHFVAEFKKGVSARRKAQPDSFDRVKMKLYHKEAAVGHIKVIAKEAVQNWMNGKSKPAVFLEAMERVGKLYGRQAGELFHDLAINETTKIKANEILGKFTDNKELETHLSNVLTMATSAFMHVVG